MEGGEQCRGFTVNQKYWGEKMIFEELFAKTDNEKILDKLEEIKQLMVPKVVYVPIYVEQKTWWHCEPLDYTYPEEFRTYYGMDFAEHACLSSVCVST